MSERQGADLYSGWRYLHCSVASLACLAGSQVAQVRCPKSAHRLTNSESGGGEGHSALRFEAACGVAISAQLGTGRELGGILGLGPGS